MIRTKRRTEITIEQHRVILVNKRQGHSLGHCDGCGSQVRMLTAEMAAILGGVSPRVIYRRVETGKIHYTETPDGQLLICANSVGPK